MKITLFTKSFRRVTIIGLFLFSAMGAFAQTNVYDNVIATSSNHTYLKAAIDQEGLASTLQNNSASFTVFAPENAAFDSLAASLGTSVSGLLDLPNLTDILLYHVLNVEVAAADVNNGAIVTPIDTTNTLKLTKTSSGAVFVNQAQVVTADLSTDNGVVHSINKIVLSSETVVDIAIDNGFTSLTAAVVEAELLPVLTDPLASFTVFAPTNDAFDSLAAALNTDINGLLALSNLADILTYHVLNSEVTSSAVSNGAIVNPISTTNTLKLTKKASGNIFVNHAEVTTADLISDNGLVHVLNAVVLPSETVVDVAIDNSFSTLTTAVVKAELLPALTDPFANFTVFAPTNEAFDSLAANLNTDLSGVLALSNLSDVLTYHVLGNEVTATMVSNGAIVNPLSTTNSLKFTVTSLNEVFVNQAQVISTDIEGGNGIVHVIDAVVLPNETVVDVALDNNFSTLATAVVTAELLPALTDPFADYTVFAPTNEAFDSLAANLNTDLAGILALPNLSDVLTYHVLGVNVPSTNVTNGLIVDPLSASNSLKFTVTSASEVFVNQAQVIATDLDGGNGVVHVLDAVVLPNETVVDIALDNNFSTLATAVVTAELLPALSDPFTEFTVFAPTNEAFDNLAASLNTDINGILALENLGDILLYHVVEGEVKSTDLVNGNVTTLSGADIIVDLSNGVMINTATVTQADVDADNGVVHVIDEVLQASTASVNARTIEGLAVYPNPASSRVEISSPNSEIVSIRLMNVNGAEVLNVPISAFHATLDLKSLSNGTYFLNVVSVNGQANSVLVISQ